MLEYLSIGKEPGMGGAEFNLRCNKIDRVSEQPEQSETPRTQKLIVEELVNFVQDW